MRASTANKIAGIVMAGGKSSRMGRDKALLRITPEMSFLRGAFDKLQAVTDKCYVSCAPGRPYAGYPCIEDSRADSGPAAGIQAALAFAAAHGYSHIFALACDMPLITCALLRNLVENRGGSQLLTVYQSAQTGCLEMLAAIYAADALQCFSDSLAKGENSLRAIIPADRRKRIAYSEKLAPYFMNCNTPEDLRRARELMGYGPEINTLI